ncbi:MAG: pimeloyl-ACP methyl ester carboxylesterase [Hyphomicrobiaceae bacterium]|jgi:pimeloyl-ACP methyl ester carboxylesterase
MSAIRPFRIAVPEAELIDLKSRLELTRFPEKETTDDWSQGIPLAYVRELVEYWRHEYDWRRAETRLNAHLGFKTNVDGLDIHFLHARSPHKGARALIMTHGWPGAIVEFLDIIGPLTDPVAYGGKAEDAFHVVCPSLPGYGFSDKPAVTGWKIAKIAKAWAEIMARLGYYRYFAQGGDWGSAVTNALATHDKAHCLGIHLNLVSLRLDTRSVEARDPLEKRGVESMKTYRRWESGYSKQQSTRPQTLGYALVDSPVGQMAWIIEKFHAWTDCDGHPENALTKDQMLDIVMMYWLNAAAASSARLYWESFREFSEGDVETPMGATIYPKEVFAPSRRWAEARFKNIVYWNERDKGGHFPALEQPAGFVEEVRNCFRVMR